MNSMTGMSNMDQIDGYSPRMNGETVGSASQLLKNGAGMLIHNLIAITWTLGLSLS